MRSDAILRAAFGVFVVAALAAAPRRAAAADPNPEERALADVRFREGRDLMEKQRFDDACAKFDDSERLWPRGGTVLNLAACREKQGRLATAWAAYTRALPLAEKEGRADRVELAKRKIADLEGQLSWLVIQVPPELDVPGAVITRDGAPVGRGAWNMAVPVDPGRHVVVANVAGAPPIEAVVDVGARGDRRVVTLPRSAGAPHVLPEAGASSRASILGPPAPPPLGVVRLHVDADRRAVRLFSKTTTNAPDLALCVAPCDILVDGRAGQTFYFEGGSQTPTPPFQLHDKRGDLLARVRAGNDVESGIGFGLTLLGLGAIIPGGVIAIVGFTSHDAETGRLKVGLGVAGVAVFAASAAAIPIGIALYRAGQTKLTLVVQPPRPSAASAARLGPGGLAVAF